MIEVERKNSVQIVRMNRPDKKNALTDGMYVDLAEAFSNGESDESIAVHLILGVDGAFSSGQDIAEFKAFAEHGELGTGVVQFLHTLPKLEKPTIAAVDGLAIGVGTTMLFHFDMVLASPKSVFKTPFLDLGLIPEAGSSLLFPRRMGHVRAFEMLCLGCDVTSEEAVRFGFVNKIVASEELEQSAFELAERTAAKPREAMRIARKLLRKSGSDEIAARIDEEIGLFRERLKSKEAISAFEAFFNRK